MLFHNIDIALTLINNSELRQDLHFLWIDNFSKSYVLRYMTVGKELWQNCQWTVRAMHTLPKGCPCPVHDLALDGVNGSPADIMDDDDWASLTECLPAVTALGRQYYEASLATKTSISNVPVKPAFALAAPLVARPACLEPSADSHANMRGLDVTDHNIGSNEGLGKVMKAVLDDEELPGGTQKGRLQVIVSDGGVFYRAMKVMVVFDCIM